MAPISFLELDASTFADATVNLPNPDADDEGVSPLNLNAHPSLQKKK
mgnify:CR=1 FL=1